MLAQISASAISLSKKFLPESENPPGLLQRLGARTVVAATVRTIQLLGRQFVLGRTITEAMAEAAGQRKATGQLRFSSTCWAKVRAPRLTSSATWRATATPSRPVRVARAA